MVQLSKVLANNDSKCKSKFADSIFCDLIKVCTSVLAILCKGSDISVSATMKAAGSEAFLKVVYC